VPGGRWPHRPSGHSVAHVMRQKKKSLTVLATVVGIVFGAFAISKVFHLDDGHGRRPERGCLANVEGAATCYDDALSAMRSGDSELAKYDFRESCPPEEERRVTQGCHALVRLLSDTDQRRTYLDRACVHHRSNGVPAACAELDRLNGEIDGGRSSDGRK